MSVEAAGAAPASEIDPFCAEFFEDPFPVHAALREAGPVVRLSRYGVWAVARCEQVYAILKVLMFLGAANRDPRRWERPDEYDISRRTIGHVGFGSGIHQCVGTLLARLEGECVLSALARRATAVEITGPQRRRYNNTLRGLASLPVALHPA